MLQADGGYRSKSETISHEARTIKDGRLDLQPLLKLMEKSMTPNRDAGISKGRLKQSLKASSGLGAMREVSEPMNTLTKTRTAINDLQNLITPRLPSSPDLVQTNSKANNAHNSFGRIVKHKTMDGPCQDNKATQGQVVAKDYIQHYKKELARMAVLLVNEEKKNSGLMLTIYKLEKELQEAKNQQQNAQRLLGDSASSFMALQAEHDSLRQLARQQMVINLELEALVGKVTIQHENKLSQKADSFMKLCQTFAKQEEKHLLRMKTVERELLVTRLQGQEQTEGLMAELKEKSIEINRLRINLRVLSLQNQPILEKAGTSTLPSSFNPERSTSDLECRLIWVGTDNWGGMTELNLYQNSDNLMERSVEETLRLRSPIFEEQLLRTRPFSKTDRH